MDPIVNFHADAIKNFRSYKKLAERALEQVGDDEFFQMLDPESNSIAVMVKHIAGNLHSRFSDFLTSDGEKPSRHRDREFEQHDDTREGLKQHWESGWETLFSALVPLERSDLARTVTIRGEPHTVVEAINRQLTHYAYHIGQVVFLAKHLRSSEWQTLSVPRNRSAEFNQYVHEKLTSGTPPAERLLAPEEFRNR